ncbi:MAG: hypothetical protein M1547_02925 [Gammaproteobacteria bacterium]|nr:hypothetical protein [Gammaproteobacteria bacterium]
MKKLSSKGRPRKSEITRFKVMAWFNAVAEASGKTAAELEREFAPAEHVRWVNGMEIRPRLWEKYRRGEVEPRSGCSPKGAPNLVERVEQRYPETAVWLSSPLWRLADKAPMEMSDIRGIYEGLPKLLRSIFIMAPHEEGEVFWRRPVAVDHVCEILLRIGGLDALVVALALVKEAEITQYQDQHEIGVDTVRQCLALLQHDQILGGKLLRELYRYLEHRWKKVKYYRIPGKEDE